MKLKKYKGFIIVNNSIWFDNDDWNDCKSFQNFAKNNQVYEFIDLFHEKYYFDGDKYKIINDIMVNR